MSSILVLTSPKVSEASTSKGEDGLAREGHAEAEHVVGLVLELHGEGHAGEGHVEDLDVAAGGVVEGQEGAPRCLVSQL